MLGVLALPRREVGGRPTSVDGPAPVVLLLELARLGLLKVGDPVDVAALSLCAVEARGVESDPDLERARRDDEDAGGGSPESVLTAPKLPK